MNLEIISPEKILFRGEVKAVTLPGEMGSFTILQNHAPIVSLLRKGNISFAEQSQKTEIPIESGFIEAKNNILRICVE